MKLPAVKLPAVKRAICSVTRTPSGAKRDKMKSLVYHMQIRNAIMPIFQELSKPELLEKCFHGKTQNFNEALNAFMWKRLPKHVFIGPYV